MVTLTCICGWWFLFYNDRLFIKTKSLRYASTMREVLS